MTAPIRKPPVAIRLLAISGNTRRPSRTAALVRLVEAAVAARLRRSASCETHSGFLELAAVAPEVMSGLQRGQLAAAGEAILRQVEDADVLIVGSPVYRASYTGALKHLFDLVGYDALKGKPAMIVANGGTALHFLATEHQFRPLLSFFRMLVVPTTVYAMEADFQDLTLASAAVQQRIAAAADELVGLALAGAPRGAPVTTPFAAVPGQ